MAKTNFKSVNEYIASKPKDVQAVLKLVRNAIRKAVPEAEELISYQIPLYKMNGGRVLYFAGWKEHYSLYPLGDALAAEFKKDLKDYEMSKGTIRFPLSEPVPVKLIERIAKFRAQQLTARDKGKGSRKTHRETQLDRIRRICGKMPSVAEKVSHGAPTFFVQKDKGVFTMFTENHHEDGRVAIWLPVPSGLQSALLEDAPKTYFKPPYVGSSGWIGIVLDQIGDEALEIHIREAWEISARKSAPSKSLGRNTRSTRGTRA
jgi:uncharacterized protein YdhG (YjbR/CyaY superfamily)